MQLDFLISFVKVLQIFFSFQMIPAKLDEFGREIEKPIDTWFPRRGVALALAELAPLISADSVGDLVQFFVSSGLGDRNENVRKEMLNAAVKVVDKHGKVRSWEEKFKYLTNKVILGNLFDIITSFRKLYGQIF